SADPHEAAQAAHESVWKYRHLVLGAIGIFLYVGAEVSIGSFLVNYFSQPNIGNVSEKIAAGFVSFYWGSAMVGRFIGSALLQKLRSGTVLGAAAVASFILVITSVLSTGDFAMWSIILVGLFNSVMFPNIFTLGIAGLGPLTGKGSGILVVSIREAGCRCGNDGAGGEREKQGVSLPVKIKHHLTRCHGNNLPDWCTDQDDRPIPISPRRYSLDASPTQTDGARLSPIRRTGF